MAAAIDSVNGTASHCKTRRGEHGAMAALVWPSRETCWVPRKKFKNDRLTKCILRKPDAKCKLSANNATCVVRCLSWHVAETGDRREADGDRTRRTSNEITNRQLTNGVMGR